MCIRRRADGTHESDAATERMDELVGHPTCSSYGNPIPAASDDDWAAIWLRDDAVNSVRPTRVRFESLTRRVAWIGEGVQAEPETLSFLGRGGIMPGVTVRFDGHGPSVSSRCPDRSSRRNSSTRWRGGLCVALIVGTIPIPPGVRSGAARRRAD